jgi:UDP-glucose 4-epimerase
MKNKKIIITGAGGFLGKHLVSAISGHMDLLPLYHNPEMDLLNKVYVENLPSSETVIHLAGKSFVPDSWKDPYSMFNINLNTTLNMLEYSRKKNVTQFIFPSSYLYGNPDYFPIDEKHPIRILNPYAKSKFLCEELCRSYAEDYGLKVIIFRIFNIYGPGQPDHWLIPSITSQLPSGTITLNDLEPKRDYIHIFDVIQAFIAALAYEKTVFEIFNIGSGVSYSVSEIVETIQMIEGTKCIVANKSERRKNEIMNTIADIQKATALLGWKPEVTLEKGLTGLLEKIVPMR